MQRFGKFGNLAGAALGLLLGWLSAAAGLVFLAAGVIGAIVGHALWSFACKTIAAAVATLEQRPVEQEPPPAKGSAQI